MLGYIERFSSLVIGIILFLLIAFYRDSFQFILNKDYLDKLVTISSSLFAFLLAILTIIVQSDSESIKKIKAHSSYGRFIKFNRRIVFTYLLCSLISIALIFLKHILYWMNKEALFWLANLNTSLFIVTTIEAFYFTFLFYILIMLDLEKKNELD